MSQGISSWLIALAVACLAAACTRTRSPLRSPTPAATAQGDLYPGDCADPGKEGRLGDRPTLSWANRDLDDDQVDEVIVADQTLCTSEGNCHWNVYKKLGECHRYLGTVSAAYIQRIPPRGEEGFYGLRGFWRLTGGERVLLQEYRYRRGGYRLVEAVPCRQANDDRILCLEQGR